MRGIQSNTISIHGQSERLPLHRESLSLILKEPRHGLFGTLDKDPPALFFFRDCFFWSFLHIHATLLMLSTHVQKGNLTFLAPHMPAKWICKVMVEYAAAFPRFA